MKISWLSISELTSSRTDLKTAVPVLAPRTELLPPALSSNGAWQKKVISYQKRGGKRGLLAASRPRRARLRNINSSTDFWKANMSTLQAIKYTRGHLEVLDQLLLPHLTKYDKITTCEDAFASIRAMRVRGKQR